MKRTKYVSSFRFFEVANAQLPSDATEKRLPCPREIMSLDLGDAIAIRGQELKSKIGLCFQGVWGGILSLPYHLRQQLPIMGVCALMHMEEAG